jgi:surface antigen
MLIAIACLWSDAAAAAESKVPEEPHCTCLNGAGKSAPHRFADIKAHGLDETDEIAALESIQVGLSRMDDGSPFVWKRANGRLSGIVRPTASFRNVNGALCRHVVVLLTTGFRTRTLEGVACRTNDRRWVLEG